MADAKQTFRSFARSRSADDSKHWSEAWFKTPTSRDCFIRWSAPPNQQNQKPDGGTLRLQKCLGSFGIQKDVFTLILLLHSRPWARKTIWSRLCVRRPTVMQRLCWNTKQTSLPRRFFQQTTPLSKYLQTSGMDLLTVHRFVTSTQDNLKKYARDFKGVKTATDAFVQWAMENMCVCVWDRRSGGTCAAKPETKEDKKRQASYVMTQPYQMLTASEVQVHNAILDTIIESISRRFAKNREQISPCLIPRISMTWNVTVYLKALSMPWAPNDAAFCASPYRTDQTR